MAFLDESSDSGSLFVYCLKPSTASLDSLEVSISKGKKFLAENAGNHASVTNTDMKLRDNFSQLLILEVTENK